MKEPAQRVCIEQPDPEPTGVAAQFVFVWTPRRRGDDGVADTRAVHGIEDPRSVADRPAHDEVRHSDRIRPGQVPSVIRPCVGLSPTSPLHDAGMRIEPPPSLA